MSEQNFDNTTLTGQGAPEAPKPLVELKPAEQSQALAQDALHQISADLQQANNLNAEVGGAGQTFVDQIAALGNEIQEEQAAVDAKAERLTSPYVLSPELAKVLKVSRVLKRPLLLEGEPGTGKTSLAYALAGHEDMPIIHAQCKSTTTAQELLYTFDVVKRLQDAQLGKDVSDLRQYVHLGPLGRAFASQEQVILLIDEVDKAKRDFSNDLLHELDQMSFFVNETGEEISAKNRPVVIVTSNHERDLPEPVLRRVVYHYIDFPDAEQMTEIVRAHVPDVSDRLLQSAIQRFYEVRGTEGLEKKPSTSEILDWIKILREFDTEEVGSELPFPETLLKNKEDIDRLGGRSSGKAEELKSLGMPESVVAALDGDVVYRLRGDYRDPDSRVYLLLANMGYKFNTAKDYGRVKFSIDSPNLKVVDDLCLIFKCDENGAPLDPKLEAALRDSELLQSEFVVNTGATPVQFTKVEESTGEYIKGEDENGITVYRLADGSYTYETAVEKPQEIVPLDHTASVSALNLSERPLDALSRAGINTVDDFIKKLENEGEDSLLSIDGFGRKALIDAKRRIRQSGYQIAEHHQDGDEVSDEDLLGESTLAKLRGQKFEDEDEETS